MRGVCVGPGKHLLPGDVADIDDATFSFLRNIGAVEAAPEDSVTPADVPAQPVTTAPARAGKKES